MKTSCVDKLMQQEQNKNRVIVLYLSLGNFPSKVLCSLEFLEVEKKGGPLYS